MAAQPDPSHLQHPGSAEHPVVDVADHLLLTEVVVHYGAAAGDRRVFRVLVERTILRVGAQPVAEHAESDGFWAVRAEHVQVHPGFGQPQAAVLVEGRFPNGEDVADLLQCRDVGTFVCGSYGTTVTGCGGGGPFTQGFSSGSGSVCRVISSLVGTIVGYKNRKIRVCY